MSYWILGPPRGFCSGKTDGAYGNPENNKEFFFCQAGTSTGCQACGSGVFFAECRLCLPEGSSKIYSFFPQSIPFFNNAPYLMLACFNFIKLNQHTLNIVCYLFRMPNNHNNHHHNPDHYNNHNSNNYNHTNNNNYYNYNTNNHNNTNNNHNNNYKSSM